LTDGSTTRKGLGDKAAVYAQTEPRLQLFGHGRSSNQQPSEGVA